jgi:hypothetical protein
MDVVEPAEAATEVGMEDDDENILRDGALTILFVVVVVTITAMIAVLL